MPASSYATLQPRASSGRGVFGWTTAGGAAAPVVLTVFGVMLVQSSKNLLNEI